MDSQTQINQQRVQTLPLAGNKTSSARALQQQNQQTTMMSAQANADTAYDPPPAPRPTQAVVVESFQKRDDPLVFATGMLSIIVGLVFIYKSM